MESTIFESFTNQYAVSKTLRFELIPQGKTMEYIEKKGLIKQDEDRAVKYKKVKKIIDEYHKDFIEKALSGLRLKGLQDYVDLYLNPDKDDKSIKEFEKANEFLRKEISSTFKKHEGFKSLFTKELIRNDLLNSCREEDKEDIKGFKDFTTYFVGFHQNRENMYVPDEKATAVAYRLIHENLPKFIDNIKIFERIKKEAPELSGLLHKALDEMKEIINGKSLDEIFSPDCYNETLTQKGIDIYNTIIGGRTPEEGKKKIKGLNEYINTEHNQQQADKKKRLPRFKQLYKQILSDRQSFSFLSEAFQNDSDILEGIESFYSGSLLDFSIEGRTVDVLESIKGVVSNLEIFDLSKIYFRSGTALTDVSQRIFGDWSLINRALEDFYKNEKPIGPREKPEKYEERRDKWLKQDFGIATLQAAINGYDNETVKEKNSGRVFVDYFAGFCDDNKIDLLLKIQERYNAVKDLLNVLPYPEDKKLGGEKEQINRIKTFLDTIMSVIHFVRPLSLKDADKQKDEVFYSQFTPLFDQLSKTIPLYNRVRNYLTQKPYSIEKFKLNFDSSYLLSGWAQDYETKGGLVFFKDGKYYLGIVEKKLSDDDKHKLTDNYEANPACRIIYDFQKPDNKNIPRLFIRSKGDNFAPAVSKYNLPIDKVLRIYDEGKFQTKYRKTNLSEYKQSLTLLIDYFKEGFSKHESYNHFDFKWKDTNEYNDISEFYKDVETSCYNLLEENINFDILMEFVDEGKLYLFQIYNKDFSQYSKGNPNLHTLYWRMLFDKTNLKDVVYKLNGQAEIFFRKKSIEGEKIIIHRANEYLKNKNPDNPKATSRFDYEIIKDKRYTLDKFQFHVPITMNFKAKGVLNINPAINTCLKETTGVNIIGIDRGERHLLYFTLINRHGKILKQDTLNIIANKKQRVNYHGLLDKKEGDRAAARQEWGIVENIKELKEGYLSQVIHNLTDLMIANNAVIAMEDLNFGFKRGRQKVEKQVYQKFEKMLIDKLNYLVDKNKKMDEPGGLLKAEQLTNKFESFQKMGKQNGVIFYIPAWNTSKIDPATGFVDFLKPKYENLPQAKEFFNKFDSISFNSLKDYFEFAFDYKNFTEKAEGGRTKWVVCTTNEERFAWNRDLNNNKGGQERYDVTGKMKALFNGNGIKYKDGNELKSQIIKQDSTGFFRDLIKALGITLAIRYNNGLKGEKEQDYILSPVADNKGRFFDSRKADASMPQNADANGAYHIALKGLWCLEQIRQATDLTKVKLAMTNKEWLQFKQEKVM